MRAGSLELGAATLALALAAMLVLTAIFVGDAWLGDATLSTVLVGVAVTGARVLTGRHLLPTATGALAGAVRLLGPWALGGEAPAALVAEAQVQVSTEAAPVEPGGGLRWCIALFAIVLLLLIDAVAADAAAPATAALFAIAPIVVVLPFDDRIARPVPIIVTAVLAVALLAAGQYRARRQARLDEAEDGPAPRRWLVGAAIATVAALIVGFSGALVAQRFAPDVRDYRVAFTDEFDRLASQRPNPLISLGRDLRALEAENVFTYSSSTGGTYFALTSVSGLMGDTWAPTAFVGAEPETVGDAQLVSRATERAAGVPVTRTEQAVAFTRSPSRYVLLPTGTARVRGLDVDWQVDTETGTGRFITGQVRDERYSVTGERVSADDISELTSLTVGGSTPYDGLTELPDSAEARQIAEIARRVTAGASTPAAQALALQNYLLSPEFAYSLTAPSEHDYDAANLRATLQFLTDGKAGYCVHFASAYTVMARSLGLPTRLVIGYTPGQATDASGNTFTVTSKNLHAWPEVYFDGAGWLRFEPTPSIGEQPRYAEAPPRPADEATPSPTPTATPSPTASPTPSATPTPTAAASTEPTAPADAADGSDGTGAQPDLSWLWPALIVIGALATLLLLLAVPALLRALVRRRRLGRVTLPATGVYDELLATAIDHRLPVEPRAPSNEALAVIGQALSAAPLAEAERLALTGDLERAAVAFDAEQYAPPGAARPGHDSAGDLVARLDRGLRAGEAGFARVRARVLPASLWVLRQGPHHSGAPLDRSRATEPAPGEHE